MKNKLRGILYLDAPAQGTVLAWTLLFVWSHIAATLFFFLRWFAFRGHLCFDSIVNGICIASIPFALYALWLLGQAFFHAMQRCRENRAGRLATSGLVFLVVGALLAATPDAYERANNLATAAFLYLLLVPLVLLMPRIRTLDFLLFLLACAACIAIGCVYVHHIQLGVLDVFRDENYSLSSSDLPAFLQKWLYIPGLGWGWLTTALFAAILLFYIQGVRILKHGANLSWRQLLGRASRNLWVICGCVYLLSLGVYLFADFRVRQERKTIGRLCGHSLDRKSLEEAFYQGRSPHTAFWKQFTGLATQSAKALNQAKFRSILGTAPDFTLGEMPASLYAEWRDAFLHCEVIPEMERMLDQPLPPPPRDFGTSPLSEMLLADLTPRCTAVRIEWWRIRFALDDKDFAAADQALTRIRHISDSLETQALFLIDSMVWIAINAHRLTAIRQVLESGLADEEWMERQSAQLEDLERRLPILIRQSVIAECTHLFDLYEHVIARQGNWLHSLRWFVPTSGWIFAHQAYFIAHGMRVSDFTDCPPFGARISKKVKTMHAYLAAHRALLKAERIHRQTGQYPTQIDDLPVDPFSGKPLRYAVGPCKVEVRAWKPGHYTITKEVQAVQVWSIGPNAKDDGGLNRWETSRLYRDDIRFLLPIRP